MSEDSLQPALFDEVSLQPIQAPEYEQGMTIRERWWRFHLANLFVYDLLVKMALELKRKGFKKCSVALLFERLRWEHYLQTKGEEPYQLNNSYRALYSRFIMSREPSLAGFFETRTRTSEPDKEPL